MKSQLKSWNRYDRNHWFQNLVCPSKSGGPPVVFDHVLKFHSHVSTIVSKANRILGMIKRCFTTLNQSTLLVLYIHQVKTQLEYCNTVWNHGYLTDMAKLEKVQWRATRILPTLRSFCYEERLHHLKLPTLSHRQFRGVMLTTFQILLWILMPLSFFWSLNNYT